MTTMRRLLLRLSPLLHLTRVTTAFGVVANAWFVVLWTHFAPEEPGTATFREMPLWLLLSGAAINALGLFGFATALNDVLDRRRDQILHPDRPLPSGRMTLEAAVSFVVFTLATAVLGATVLGTLAIVLTLVVAGAALFFNAAGKYIPALGLVVLGLIHAGQMVTPNLELRFVLPVWLVMTHALLVAGAAHVFGRKAPGISVRAAVLAVSGWAFWSSVMITVGWYRNRGEGGLLPNWVEPRAYIAPVVLAGVFGLIVWRRVATLGRGPRVGEKITRYGALWLALYATAWSLGQGDARGATILGSLAVFGVVGMTVIRELYAIIETPVGYRR